MLVQGDLVRYVGPMKFWAGSTGTVREMDGEKHVKVVEHVARRSKSGHTCRTGAFFDRNSLWPMQDVEVISLWPQVDPGDPPQRISPQSRYLSFKQWQRAAYENALAKGFHHREDGTEYDPLDPERIAARLALIHGEVSEALEECARGRMDLWHSEGGKPEGFGVELADVFLRLVDLAESTGVNLGHMVRIKHWYNLSRPIRHGGKKL